MKIFGSKMTASDLGEALIVAAQRWRASRKRTSVKQAKIRSFTTTDNDEYESVSVIERPVGPLSGPNMMSEFNPAAWGLPLKPKQSKNSPSCPLIESNFYKNLVETLQKSIGMGFHGSSLLRSFNEQEHQWSIHGCSFQN
ncbi:Hypothetical_protein [Hexamita inflata]|uniref:Hypothetical_protein n=1 Tax=Hexamita inflata TaxID=28002 RepID=A0AA86PGW3_9EUKA|nr:Hypothetical protein HINF_LOCUS23365 [Hexamita inflata]